MRILITGATGFAGGWLCEALLGRGQGEVLGVSRHTHWPQPLRHLADRVRLASCDLGDPAALAALLGEWRPEQIYHLAGYPHVGRSLDEQDAAWAGNHLATRNLYEAMLKVGIRPRVLAVTSGMVYGDSLNVVGQLDEDAPLRPTSPYGTSKATADLLSYQYTRSHDLEIVRARPFNHIGPRQSPDFVIPRFAMQLAQISKGKREPVLETGNLANLRDFTDVRDVADAYVRLMERGRVGEAYNVASGQEQSVRAVLDQLIVLSGLEVEVRSSAPRPQALDPRRMSVSHEKIGREVGWRPTIPLKQTLADTLAWWQAQGL